MKEGAILANSGHFDVEIAMNQLREISSQIRQVRQNVCEYSLPNGVHIHVIGEGRLVNLAAADGHPIEIMDTSFAIQCMSLLYLWKNRGKLENRLMKLPDEIDYGVASLKLKSMGVHIDALSDRQQEYLNSY
jgi:adenosylhomocysteinase